MVTARQNSRIAKLAKAGLTCRQVAAIVGLGEDATRHRIARMRKAGTIPPAMECRARYADKVAEMVAKMTDTPELLPCPFCGRKPEGPIDATKVLGVWRIVHRGCVIANFSIERPKKEDAIAAWNTRAPDSRVAALDAKP